MPHQFNYNMRAQPTGYMPVNYSNYPINRVQQQPVQLPRINQFVGALNGPHYSQPANHQQNPYYNQLQFKNLMTSHQARMQGNSSLPMYLSQAQMSRPMQQPQHPTGGMGYNMGQMGHFPMNPGHMNPGQMNQGQMKPGQYPYHK